MPQHVHIISLNVPYPADYGGMFDIFYKLVALHTLGIYIHLHCFEYGRGRQPELEKYCHSIHYYPRRKTLSFTLPYIVASRRSKALFQNLLKDNYPILMEGIHCSWTLLDKRFGNRALDCVFTIPSSFITAIYTSTLPARCTSSITWQRVFC